MPGLEEAIEEIRKRYGPTAIMWGDEIPERKTRFSTGSLSIDLAIGGGWLAGYMYEVFGKESSLKTTISLRSAASYQKISDEHLVVYVDVEYALEKSWLEINGVDPKRFLYVNPDTSETALESVIIFLKQGIPVLCIVDSIASLSPAVEKEEDSLQPGLLARAMNKFLRRAISYMRAHPESTMLLLNQIRMKIGVPKWANPETEPGGEGRRFFAGARISLRRIKWVTKGEDKKKTGMTVAFEVRKSKISAPAQSGEFNYNFYDDNDTAAKSRTIDTAGEVISLGQLYNVVKKRGKGLSVLGKKFASDQKARRYLNENRKFLRKAWRESIKEKAN